MTIPAKTLSETLASMAASHLAAIHSRLDCFDDMLCTAMLIEAARVMDYETVLMASDPESYHLPYPTFDVMSRGWNSLLSYALPRLPRIEGMPFAESTAETRAQARSLLHAFGEAALLQKAADMSFHGLLKGSENDDGISLKSIFGEDSDHFHDQLETEALENALGETRGTLAEGLLTADEAHDIAATLVRPFETTRGTIVGYEAHPRIDAHFVELVGPKFQKWQGEAGIHPEVNGDGLNGAHIGAVVFMLTSFYLKHIWLVGVGPQCLPNINYFMSLTIWKKPDGLIDSISSFTGIEANKIAAALRAVVVTREDAAYFHCEPTPCMPMLIEISEGYWLAPVSSVFRNPLTGIRMLNEFRQPATAQLVRQPRERWMTSDLYALFEGTRYRVLERPARLKRGGRLVTDIDAAVLDVMTGELGLFQLKWQDLASHRLEALRSKAKNFTERVSLWADQVEDWIEHFGEAELCRCLKLKLPKGVVPSRVIMFAIGRVGARFKSYGYNLTNGNIATCNWNQFLRLRYEVGPAERVLSEIHSRVFDEQSRIESRKPIAYSFEVGGKAIRFEDMWTAVV